MLNTSRREERQKKGFFGFLIAVLITLVSTLLLVTPGLALVAAARAQFGQPLQTGVMWACAAFASLALFAILWWRTSEPRKSTQAPRLLVAARVYFGLCLLTVGALATAHWVFQSEFPAKMVGYYASAEHAQSFYGWLGMRQQEPASPQH